MAKVTSKLQVTLPKAIATAHGIEPGAEIEWVSTGDVIRIVPAGSGLKALDAAERLRRFDLATARQRRRRPRAALATADRGWTRAELYERGRAR
jgi:bifunctional DNA-binding transcriptional regulator/antitoxin component of YhaV-PrlF toxin-antitoxin module